MIVLNEAFDESKTGPEAPVLLETEQEIVVSKIGQARQQAGLNPDLRGQINELDSIETDYLSGKITAEEVEQKIANVVSTLVGH